MNETPLITVSQEILGGTPVFYGTRVPVQTLTDYLIGGDTLDEFLEQFPSVSREQAIRYLHSAQQVLIAFYDEYSDRREYATYRKKESAGAPRLDSAGNGLVREEKR